MPTLQARHTFDLPLPNQLAAVLADLPADQLDHLPSPDSPKGYQRVSLHADDQLEVAAARWRAGGQSSLHGHGDSAAMYVVHAGLIEEERYLPEGDTFRYERRVLRAGDRTYLPAGSFHCVRALEESVTLHAYSPPPADPTSEVPPATLRRLEQARRGTGPHGSPGRTLPVRPVRPDLLVEVNRLLDNWAEREEVANRDGTLSMPAETLAEMRTSGLLAAPLPVHLGGWDASLRQAAEAVRRIAQRAPATALALVMPLGNAATTRIPELAVNRTQRPALIRGQRWIAEQVRQGRILAVANSEPGAGGDLKNTRTTACCGEDGVYRLTGRKSFATFGRDADWFLCAARRPDSADGWPTSVVDGFFVAREAPGLTIDDRWDPVGMRPTASVGLVLENAPAEAILGYPGCLEGVNARHWSTVLFAAVFLGVGEGALREGVRQTSPGAGWAKAALADRALELEAAAGFVETVARDDRFPLPADLQERTRRAKTFVARVAVQVAVQAAMTSGGRCYTPDHPVFRFLCHALAGPLLRPPLPQAMDSLVQQLFPAEREGARGEGRGARG